MSPTKTKLSSLIQYNTFPVILIILVLLFRSILSKECLNGGYYNEERDSCECLSGFSGLTCERISCENGGMYVNSSNSCVCSEGWDGLKCNQCLRDNVCSKNYKCLKNQPLSSLKNLQGLCSPSNKDMVEMFGETFEILTSKVNRKKDLFFQGWRVVNDVSIPTLNCKMKKCDLGNFRNNKGLMIDQIICESSNCTCNSAYIDKGGCNRMIKRTIDGIYGMSKIECIHNEKNQGNCEIKFSHPSWLINVDCKISKCSDQEPIGLKPVDKYLLFIKWLGKVFNKWKYILLYNILILMMTFIMMIIISVTDRATISKKMRDKNIIWITLKNLTIFYRKFSFLPLFKTKILENLNIDINIDKNEGVSHLLIAKNGTGKTTLIKAVAQISSTSHYNGSICYNDRINLNCCKNIAASYNTDVFSNKLTVSEILKFSALFRGMPLKIVNSHVKSILRDYELNSCKNKTFDKLSTGYKKLLSVANVVAQNTKIMIFDEPTNGVDNATAGKILNQINHLSSNHVVIVIAHNIPDVLFDLFKEITVIGRDGNVVSGKPKNVMRDINQLYVNSKRVSKYQHIINYLEQCKMPNDVYNENDLLSNDDIFTSNSEYNIDRELLDHTSKNDKKNIVNTKKENKDESEDNEEELLTDDQIRNNINKTIEEQKIKKPSNVKLIQKDINDINNTNIKIFDKIEEKSGEQKKKKNQ